MGELMSGQWDNAPLTYVVGMVRFARMTLNQGKMNLVHDLLRKDFPQIELRHQNVQEISFNADARETSVTEVQIAEWSLLNPNSSTGILIRPDALFLHTIAYQDHKVFESQMRKALEALNSIIPIEFVQTIGLRTIDVMQETQNLSLADCIVPELQPLNISDDNEVQNTVIQMDINAGDVALKCLCIHLTELPKERVSMDLMPLRSLLAQIDEEGSGKPAIILDTDCVYQKCPNGMMAFDANEVVDIIEHQLHSRASKAFKKATTVQAREEWKHGNK